MKASTYRFIFDVQDCRRKSDGNHSIREIKGLCVITSSPDSSSMILNGPSKTMIILRHFRVDKPEYSDFRPYFTG